jgi:hypothetical protein
MANDKDLFWSTEVTKADDKKVALLYYHYLINRNDKKIYKLHNSTGSYGLADSSVTFPQKIELLPKMEEFAKPASKKYRKNTICTLERKYSKF